MISAHLPKRYTIYPPLLLLPANFPTVSPAWLEIYRVLSHIDREALFACIVNGFAAQGVTHLALNAPVVASVAGTGVANFMRSPTGLVPLYGDFGPRDLLEAPESGSPKGSTATSSQPTQADLDAALWISTTQNAGIFQTWAPLYTMFSRGNTSEKARILGSPFDDGAANFAGLDGEDGVLAQRLCDIAVVDLFVGIGYFAFSYLKRGVGIVWGWEINGWSVEGCRRGAGANSWTADVIGIDNQGRVKGGTKVLEDVHGKMQKRGMRCLIFQGDNRWAGDVVAGMKEMCGRDWKRVRHVNLGLLPEARASWENAVRILDDEAGGWLHVHENADVAEINARRDEIVLGITRLTSAHREGTWEIACVHVEHVKTFAPGVMHCVFDIQILKPSE